MRSDETSSATARSMQAAMLSSMQKPRDSKWPFFLVGLSNIPWILDQLRKRVLFLLIITDILAYCDTGYGDSFENSQCIKNDMVRKTNAYRAGLKSDS